MHPVHLLDDEDFVILELWQAYRRDAMGAPGHLPFAGGYAEQPAALMRALEACSAVEARIRARERPRGG